MLRAYHEQVEIVSRDCIETYGGARRLHDRIPHHQVPNRGIRTRGAAGAIHASRAAMTAGAALAALSLSPEGSGDWPRPGQRLARPRSMQSARRAPLGTVVGSVVGVEPSVEDPDGVIEVVGSADRHESLTAADSAGAA
jgi:hypothetical protein